MPEYDGAYQPEREDDKEMIKREKERLNDIAKKLAELQEEERKLKEETNGK